MFFGIFNLILLVRLESVQGARTGYIRCVFYCVLMYAVTRKTSAIISLKKKIRTIATYKRGGLELLYLEGSAGEIGHVLRICLEASDQLLYTVILEACAGEIGQVLTDNCCINDDNCTSSKCSARAAIPNRKDFTLFKVAELR